MDLSLKVIVLLSVILRCNGVSLREQIAHIARRWREIEGDILAVNNTRRGYNMDGGSVIIGAPAAPSHLPEAEPILPGHTLIRPALGMLKSAVKFPHKELDNGAGVYGNINNIGIRWDSRNERLMYSGFRRTQTDLRKDSDSDSNDSESDSDESQDELPLRQNKKNSNNNVIRLVKIYPAKPINKIPRPNKKNGKKNIVYNDRGLATDSNKNKKRNIMYVQLSTNLKKNRDDDEDDNELNQLIKDTWASHGLHGNFNMKNRRALASRLYSSAARRAERSKQNGRRAPQYYYLPQKTLIFAKKLLKKLHATSRRQKGPEIIVLSPKEFNNDDDDAEDDNVDQNIEATEAPQKNNEKMKWFWNSKNAFNHVKFNPDAPDHEDYLPRDAIDTEDLRHWWYYHQNDFQPLDALGD